MRKIVSKLTAKMFKLFTTVAALAVAVSAHGDHEHEDQEPVAGPHKSLWYNTLPGDGGTQVSGKAHSPQSAILY